METKNNNTEEKKSKLNISSRDKMLLVIVFCAAIIALAYFLGFSNLNSKKESYEKELTTLKTQEKTLQDMNNNKTKYQSDTAQYQSRFNSLVSNFASGNTQPYVIDFLNQLESSSTVWIKSTTFSEPVVVYNFGKNTTTNPNSSGKAYSTDMVGYSVTLNVSYEAEDYESWKKMIDFINDYKSNNKNIIDQIGSQPGENGSVSGTMVFTLFSIVGSDRKFTEPTFNVSTGTTSIFAELSK